MTNLKISQLTDGGALQATDEVPVERSGSNFKVAGSEFASGGSLPDQWTVLTGGGLQIDQDAEGIGLQINAAAGSEADGAELVEVNGDEGHRLMGFDGWGQFAFDLYEHTPFTSTTEVFTHPASSPVTTRSIAQFSTGKEGIAPTVGTDPGGVMLRAITVAQPVRVLVEDASEAIRVNHDGTMGFFGQTPAAQPAAPVTLADVIAALKALGLVAT